MTGFERYWRNATYDTSLPAWAYSTVKAIARRAWQNGRKVGRKTLPKSVGTNHV